MKQSIRQNREHALALKVDVDTYIGMKRGVPRLLSTLSHFGVKATFFLSIGPDASGRAVLQLIKNPRFLRKMVRTNAGRLYGIRTALYGTLLPSPMVALAFPELVKRILSEGHEVEFHAWDHRRWQDDLFTHSSAWIEEWFQKGIDAYTQLVGSRPSSFGAPGWLIDDKTLETAGKYGFAYLSCTRAQKPFIHEISGLMEIPSDLPCLEEIGVDTFVPTILNILKDGGIHVLPVHAEAEGGIWNEHFTQLLAEILDTDYRIVPLSGIKNILHPELLSIRKHRLELLPGRSALCAV